MSGHDPVYPYLINAANLASGYMELGLIEHPGTPVECFGGVLIFLRHLVSGHLPAYQEVLRNPESYLHMLSAALILLLGFVLFCTGSLVYRKTGNLSLAIFFQLFPLLGPIMIEHAILFKPESFIVITGGYFAAFLYVSVFGPQYNPEQGLKPSTIILSSLFLGLLIATKIICAPFVLILFFLCRTWKQFFLFCISLSLSFLLFILPAIPKYMIIWQWMQDLLNHDGIYGHGKEQIINSHEFVTNLKKIFTTDVVFTGTWILLTAALVVSVIRLLRKKVSDHVLTRFIAGLWLSISVLILMVAKHFSIHYLIAGMTFFPLSIVLSFRVFVGIKNIGLYKRYPQIVPYTLFCLVIVFYFYREGKSIFLFRDHKNPIQNTVHFLDSKPGMAAITISDDHSAFIAPSIWFGIMYSGDMRSEYFHFIKEYYQNWFAYHLDTKEIIHWDEGVLLTDILKKRRNALVYFIDHDPIFENNLMKEFTQSPKGLTLAKYKIIYENKESAERVYLMEGDSVQLARLPVARAVYYSDLEKTNADHSAFLSNDSLQTFKKANQVSQSEHHSGTNSIQLNNANQYGLDLEFEVKPGDFVEATIWRKSSDHSGGIVLSAKDNTKFYLGGEAIIATENGWEQITCKGIIPIDYKEKTVNFYLYYNLKKEVYFDDVKITVTPGE